MVIEQFTAQPLAPLMVRRAMLPVDDALLADFRRRRVVVLSPHFDDACFSLGVLLSRLNGGDLINVFTQGDYLARPRMAQPMEVFAIRDAEDALFAGYCHLRRHDLGCEEPSRRGRRPSQLQYVEDDIDQIGGPLLGKLEKLAAGFAPDMRGVLLAPLGIGRHVNHRAVAALVQRNLLALQQRYDVFFYEDQPYARKLLDRLTALSRVRRLVALKARHTLPVRWQDKRDMLNFYPSQARGRPLALDYWPARSQTHDAA